MGKPLRYHIVISCVLHAVWLAGCNGSPGLFGFDGGVDGGLDAGPDGGPCPANRRYCVGQDLVQCQANGRTEALIETCTDACDGELGCVRCLPGAGRCDDGWSTRCASDGSSYFRIRDCEAAGSTCGPSGFCEDACGDAERRDSNLGCRFTAAPLLTDPTAARQLGLPFRIIVANPATGAVARVKVMRGDDEVASGSVERGEQRPFDLDWIEEMSFRLGTAGDQSWESFVVADAAYHVVSDSPVTAFQFSPATAGGIGAFFDASLLLPQHALSGEFYAVSWEPFSAEDFQDFPVPGYIAVSPAGVDPVTVHVDPTVDVLGASGHWDDTEAGRAFEFTLSVGEVAHLLPTMPPECTRFSPGAQRGPTRQLFCSWDGHDLTGTAFRASGPLAIFSGHVAAMVPLAYGPENRLEEQLPPSPSWGLRHLVVPLDNLERIEGPARNVVRIVAAHADTSLSIAPPPEGFESAVLQPGEFFDALLSEPSVIEGSDPILVAQYFVGGTLSWSGVPGTPVSGEPALLIVPPVEQYRGNYTFAAPDEPPPGILEGFDDFVLLVRARGAHVELDGVAIDTDWSALGDGWEWHIGAVAGGAHAAESEAPMGLVSFGFQTGGAGSYAYAGGTDLSPPPLE